MIVNEGQPKISVIIPVYNVQNYLTDCISDVCNQSYTNLQIIMVDDGSEDESGKFCDEWEKKDSRIQVVHQSNQGLSAARNRGLDIALGDYIAFVDSDDRLDQVFLQKLYEAITQTNADMAMCGYLLLKSGEEYREKQNYPNKALYDAGDLYRMLYDNGRGHTLAVVVWNKLYRKRLFDGIRFKVGCTHEDEFLIYYILFRCSKVAWIAEDLYHYRIRENSIIRTSFSEKNFDLFYAHKDRILVLERKVDKALHCRMINKGVQQGILLWLKAQRLHIKNQSAVDRLYLETCELYRCYKSDMGFSIWRLIAYLFAENRQLLFGVYKIIRNIKR